MGHGKQFTDNPKMDPAVANRALKISGGLGVVGIGASLVALGMDEATKSQFYFSWLTAFMVFAAISLGALFFVIIHHLVRATWSATFRRIAENLAMNMPLLAVLFIPVLLGMGYLFHWSHPEAVAADPILQWKSSYLNVTGFIIRAVFFFSLWTGLAFFFRRNSVKQDATGDPALSFRSRKVAPVATLLFGLSLSFASFDWLMSLDPHWFSTMFGLYIFAGANISLFATLALVGLWMTRNGQLKNTITVGNLHDSGKMMFGFTVFWAYITFSQYFLIWYANIPEETHWFMLRSSNGWENIAGAMLIGHFIVPFWVLMSRHFKRNRVVLGGVAAWMILMQFLDIHFIVMPTLHHHGPHFHWLDLTTFIGIGGIFVAGFVYRFKKDAMVAHKDPQLTAAMEYDNA